MIERRNASHFRLGALSGLLVAFSIAKGVASAASTGPIPELLKIESTGVSTEQLGEQDSDEEGQAGQSGEESDDRDETDEEDEAGGFPRLEGIIVGETGWDATLAADDNGEDLNAASADNDNGEDADAASADDDNGEDLDAASAADDEYKLTDDYFSSVSAFLNLRLTPNLNLETDLRLESTSDDKQYARLYERAFVSLLAVSYSADIGGIQLGKLDLLEDIWDRGLEYFPNFQTVDLDLTEVIGLRTWWSLDAFLEGEHYLFGGVFFQDTTFLSGNLQTGEDRLRSEDGGLANTQQFNNIVIGLHGDGLPFASDWEYAIGFARQLAGEGNSKNELSYFSGLYGSFDLFGDAEFSPFVELLLRSGADGEDQAATTVLGGASIEKGPWTFGVSYSYRDTDAREDDDDLEDHGDNNAQLFAGYTFPSGLYVEGGYQYLREEGEDSHIVGLAIGYPFEFTISPSVKPTTKRYERDDRIRRKTRR